VNQPPAGGAEGQLPNMWECYNCDFRNVDAAPVCAKCRAPKPDPSMPRQGRSYMASQQAAQERVADQVLKQVIPPPPTEKQLREKWTEATGNREELIEELIMMEMRSYALREAINLLVNVVKAPQAKGNDIVLRTVIQTLIDWEEGN
jgi:hypothetical protein